MQSSMKNQRSSPIRPFLRTSARQALSFGLLAFHLARISLSFSRVSFLEDAGGAGAFCAETGAEEAMIMTDSTTTATTKPRVWNMNFPPGWSRMEKQAPRNDECRSAASDGS